MNELQIFKNEKFGEIRTVEELIAYFMELLAYAKESGIIVPSHHSDQK